MFTVKIEKNGVINITTEKNITVVKKGSDSFTELLKSFDGYIRPESSIETPPVYSDLEMTDCLQEAELLVSESTDLRRNVHKNCIAIIITDHEGTKNKGEPFDGCACEFIYAGDKAYVMNQSGATIEAVK